MRGCHLRWSASAQYSQTKIQNEHTAFIKAWIYKQNKKDDCEIDHTAANKWTNVGRSRRWFSTSPTHYRMVNTRVIATNAMHWKFCTRFLRESAKYSMKLRKRKQSIDVYSHDVVRAQECSVSKSIIYHSRHPLGLLYSMQWRSTSWFEWSGVEVQKFASTSLTEAPAASRAGLAAAAARVRPRVQSHLNERTQGRTKLHLNVCIISLSEF